VVYDVVSSLNRQPIPRLYFDYSLFAKLQRDGMRLIEGGLLTPLNYRLMNFPLPLTLLSPSILGVIPGYWYALNHYDD